MTGAPIQIENLKDFRSALRAADASAPRELSKAIKRAGEEVLVPAIRSKLPHITGELGKGVRISVRSTSGYVENKAPHGPGSEWGAKGKWRGWVEKYGAPPRFAWPTLQERGDELAERLAEELEGLITIMGWAG